MKAIILAAGRGMRMRPLTDHTPKALLEIRGKPLIVYHIENLAMAGIKDIVINLAHLGEQIQQKLGNGSQWGVSISYSPESDSGYETGGGVFNALDLLGTNPFLVISADIFSDYDFNQLPKAISGLAHLVLVNNPQYHQEGDFVLDNGWVMNEGGEKVTYGNIGIFHPHLFKDCEPGFFPLAPLIRIAADQNKVSGELYQSNWHNVGTPEQLKSLNR